MARPKTVIHNVEHARLIVDELEFELRSANRTANVLAFIVIMLVFSQLFHPGACPPDKPRLVTPAFGTGI